MMGEIETEYKCAGLFKTNPICLFSNINYGPPKHRCLEFIQKKSDDGINQFILYGSIKLIELVLFLFVAAGTFFWRCYRRCNSDKKEDKDEIGRPSGIAVVKEPDHFEIELEEQESPSGKYNNLPDNVGDTKSIDTEEPGV
jgi:hypothetical protein